MSCMAPSVLSGDESESWLIRDPPRFTSTYWLPLTSTMFCWFALLYSELVLLNSPPTRPWLCRRCSVVAWYGPLRTGCGRPAVAMYTGGRYDPCDPRGVPPSACFSGCAWPMTDCCSCCVGFLTMRMSLSSTDEVLVKGAASATPSPRPCSVAQ